MSAPNGKSPPSVAAQRQSSSLLIFILLVFALAVPFWVIGEFVEFQLLPGLPFAAFAFVCPGLAALTLVRRDNGPAAARALLARAFDYKRIESKIWYAPMLLLNPSIFVLSYGVLRFLGTSVPAPQLSALSTLALCALFFASAAGEELGWSGYAIDPMQKRSGALQASIQLGGIWVLFHIVALIQAHRSMEWIGWWSLWSISSRVILVWLYNNAGKSVFATILFHAMINVCWQAFPIHGSFFDPRVVGIITTFVAIIASTACRARARASCT